MFIAIEKKTRRQVLSVLPWIVLAPERSQFLSALAITIFINKDCSSYPFCLDYVTIFVQFASCLRVITHEPIKINADYNI